MNPVCAHCVSYLSTLCGQNKLVFCGCHPEPRCNYVQKFGKYGSVCGLPLLEVESEDGGKRYYCSKINEHHQDNGRKWMFKHCPYGVCNKCLELTKSV